MKAAVDAANTASSEEQRIDLLRQFCFQPDSALARLDPFSQAYLDEVRRVYRGIANRGEYEVTNELSPFVDEIDSSISIPHTIGSTRVLREIMRSIGQVLSTLDLKPG